jgi:hypothetical protein
VSFDNSDIPTAAFIEHFIFNDAFDRGVLDASTHSVAERFNVVLPASAPFVQTRVLTLGYCLLVFPAETWKRQASIETIVALAKADSHITTKMQTKLSAKFLRHLRNAISHGRVTFDGNLVEFHDVNRSGKEVFRDAFDGNEIVNFFLIVGRAFHEAKVRHRYPH